MKKIFISLLFIFGMVIALASCKKDNIEVPNTPEKTQDASNLKAQVRALPLPDGMDQGEVGQNLPPLDPIAPQIDGEVVEPGTFGGLHGIYITQRKVYNSGFAFDELSIFNPAGSLIYPGSVFVGSSITNGRYVKLPGTTGEVTWSAIDLIPASPMNNYVASYINPKASDYNLTVQRWFGSQNMPLAATTVYEINELSSSTEIGAELGVGYQKEDLIAKLNLSTSHQKMKTHVLVKAIQKVFSIAVDIPDGFILKTANVEDMDGVMPVYVSEVFYGRMGFAVISSQHEYHDVVAALNLNVPTENIDINLQTKYKEILDASVSKSRIIGGTSEEHGYGMSMGWEGFKKSLSSPLTASSAKPVAYTLRYVHDNSVARVVLTSDFVRNESYFVPDMDELVLRFTPRTLRAKSDNIKPLYVHGKVTIALAGGREQTIFERPVNNYIRIDDPEQDVALPDTEGLEVSLKRPQGMSMADFLKMEVTISGYFGHAVANGTRNLYDLGSESTTCTVRELLMMANRGAFNFFTQEKRTNKREANLVLDIQADNGIRQVDGTISQL